MRDPRAAWKREVMAGGCGCPCPPQDGGALDTVPQLQPPPRAWVALPVCGSASVFLCLCHRGTWNWKKGIRVVWTRGFINALLGELRPYLLLQGRWTRGRVSGNLLAGPSRPELSGTGSLGLCWAVRGVPEGAAPRASPCPSAPPRPSAPHPSPAPTGQSPCHPANISPPCPVPSCVP